MKLRFSKVHYSFYRSVYFRESVGQGPAFGRGLATCVAKGTFGEAEGQRVEEQITPFFPENILIKIPTFLQRNRRTFVPCARWGAPRLVEGHPGYPRIIRSDPPSRGKRQAFPRRGKRPKRSAFSDGRLRRRKAYRMMTPEAATLGTVPKRARRVSRLGGSDGMPRGRKHKEPAPRRGTHLPLLRPQASSKAPLLRLRQSQVARAPLLRLRQSQVARAPLLRLRQSQVARAPCACRLVGPAEGPKGRRGPSLMRRFR